MALEAFTDALRRRKPLPKVPTDSRDVKDSSGSIDDGIKAYSPSVSRSTFVNRKPEVSSSSAFSAINLPLQAHQVFRAIEDQDLGLLAEIAEHDFSVRYALTSLPTLMSEFRGQLLLRPLSSNTHTPLSHAIDCGTSHRGVALLLLGIFSRYVNHLSDADFEEPEARETLRLLRGYTPSSKFLPLTT